MKKQGFSQYERMRKRPDYLACFARGRKKYSAHFIIFYLDRGTGCARIGITVSKKVGNAVRRNRIKRLLREFFRLHKAIFLPGVDFSLVVKKNYSLTTLDDVVRELYPLLKRIRKSGNLKKNVSTCG